jgi:hypothetical protein
MDERDGRDGVALRFEASRVRLRAVAYRMLGSASEADDARIGISFDVQEAVSNVKSYGEGPRDDLVP